MSLPAKRGRPILPKVRTKTASVMMVVDGCGNPLVKIELFHLFFFTGLKTDRSSGGKNHRTHRKKRSRKEHGDPPDARPCKSGKRNDRTLWKTDHRDHTAGPAENRCIAGRVGLQRAVYDRGAAWHHHGKRSWTGGNFCGKHRSCADFVWDQCKIYGETGDLEKFKDAGFHVCM